MRLHYLQHVPFEDLANISPWAQEKGHSITKTLLYNNEILPSSESFDWLIIMGGPMNIYQEDKFPWLKQEKKLIEQSIKDKKKILGVCLGAQLIADVLGAKIYQNKYKEIGFFPVQLTDQSEQSIFFQSIPKEFMAFHWHGDTFDIPHKAKHLAKSEACLNQAFEYKNTLALQFHVESNNQSIKKLIDNCTDELIQAPYIQKPQDMLEDEKQINSLYPVMEQILNNFKYKIDDI